MTPRIWAALVTVRMIVALLPTMLFDRWVRKVHNYREGDLTRGEIMSAEEVQRTKEEVLAKANFGAPPTAGAPPADALSSIAYQEVFKAGRQQIIEHMNSFMSDLVQNDRLPHNLLKHHIKVEYYGGQNADGSPWIRTQYRPLECILIPSGEPRPPVLDELGVRPEVMEEFLANHKREWETLTGGTRPYDLDAVTQKGVLDGVEYRVLPLVRQTGFDRRKILNRFLKPAGYSHAKGSGTYEFRKILSDRESCGCSFDFGTWRQTVVASFTYAYAHAGRLFTVRVPFIYWGATHPGPGHPMDIDISTERIFSMAIENIAYIAQALERSVLARVPQFHGKEQPHLTKAAILVREQVFSDSPRVAFP